MLLSVRLLYVLLLARETCQQALISAPRFQPDEEEIVFSAGKPGFLLRCEGERQIVWKTDKFENSDFGEDKRFKVRSELQGNLHLSELSLYHPTYTDTKYYYCYYEDRPDLVSKIYVYVEDEDILVADKDVPSMPIKGQREELIIPCRPNSPKYSVTLRHGRGFEHITETDLNISYDPHVGFSIRGLSFTTNFECYFKWKDKVVTLNHFVVIGSNVRLKQPHIADGLIVVARLGGNFILNCSLTHSIEQNIRLKWESPNPHFKDALKTGRIFIIGPTMRHRSYSQDKTTSIYIAVQDVRLEDKGTYTCRATRGRSQSQSSKLVTLLASELSTAPRFLPDKEDIVFSAGTSDFLLRCEGESDIVWRTNKFRNSNFGEDKRLSVRSELQGNLYISELTLDHPNYTDTKYYYCYYKNNPDLVSKIYVYVEDEDVLVAKKDIPSSSIKGQGEEVTIPCRPNSPKYEVNIQMGHGSKLIKGTDLNISYDPHFGFTIKRLNFSTTFECNFYWQGKVVTLEHFVMIELYIPLKKPYITSSDAILGEKFILKCSMTYSLERRTELEWESPNPHFRDAVKTGRILIFDPNISFELETLEFIIYINIVVQDVQQEDEGTYTCHATKGRSQSLSSKFIRVKDSGTSFIEMMLDTNRTEARAGAKEVQWVVQINAYPHPTLMWYRNGDVLKNGTKYSVINDLSNKLSILKIYNIDMRDKGKYTLRGTAGIEKKEVDFLLVVNDKPVVLVQNISSFYFTHRHPYRFSCIARGYPTPAIEWMFRGCPTMNTCDPSFRPVFVLKGNAASINKPRPTSDDEVISTLSVTAENSGFYKCTAINVLGEGDQVFPFFITDVPDGVLLNASDLHPLVEDSVVLQCSASIYNYTSQISWFWIPERGLEEFQLDNTTGFQITKDSTPYSHFSRIEHPSIGINNSGKYICLLDPMQDMVATIRYRSMTVTVREELEFINKKESILTISLVSIGALICVGLIGFLIRTVMKERKKRKEFFSRKEVKQFMEGSNEGILHYPGVNLGDKAEFLPYNAGKWEFPKERLKFLGNLGKGAFGLVMKAEAIGILGNDSKTLVAVKRVKDHAEKAHRVALASELKIMSYLGHHVNIVNLLGACTKDMHKEEIFVIVEYCRFGSLEYYLQNHRKEFIDQIDPNTGNVNSSITERRDTQPYESSDKVELTSKGYLIGTSFPFATKMHRTFRGTMSNVSSGNDALFAPWASRYKEDSKNNEIKKPITTSDLIVWSWQVARGMKYLANHKIIHRDLAARNILLAEHNIVKVGDFGLARDVYHKAYHTKGDVPLPVKWMAMESIFQDKICTSKSDVWSFGITMWEIFSLGSAPYPGLRGKDVISKLKQGYRMEKPKYATQSLHDVMSECWLENPDQRPSFADLVVKMGSMVDARVREHYFKFDKKDQQRYGNVTRDRHKGIKPGGDKSMKSLSLPITPLRFDKKKTFYDAVCSSFIPDDVSTRKTTTNPFVFARSPNSKRHLSTENADLSEMKPMLHHASSQAFSYFSSNSWPETELGVTPDDQYTKSSSVVNEVGVGGPEPQYENVNNASLFHVI